MAERVLNHDTDHGTDLATLVESGEASVSALAAVIEHDDLVERVVSGRTKPDRAAKVARARKEAIRGDGTRRRAHPARYSKGMMAAAAEVVPDNARVLDPFGGVGGVFEMEEHGTYDIVCLELEAPVDAEDPDPTWDRLDHRVRRGDACDLSEFDDGSFDAVVTSPTYGNKMALGSRPLYDAETRDDYVNRLGRPLREGNTGALRWGPRYREIHEQAWNEAVRVLAPGGVFVLFCRDHSDNWQWQPVTGWHINALQGRGLNLWTVRSIITPGNRRGEGTENAIGDGEIMAVLHKP